MHEFVTRSDTRGSRRAWFAVGLICLLGLVTAVFAGWPQGVQAAPTSSTLMQDMAEPPVTVYLDPTLARIDVGERVTVTIRTTDMFQFYGFQWKLRFNPAVLQVVDADPKAGVQIIPSPVFAGKSSLEAFNAVDNTLGEISYGLSLFMETRGVDGEAVLGQVVFQAVGEGVSALRFGAGPGQSRIMCLRDVAGTESPVEVSSAWLRGRINVGEYVVYLPKVSK